MAEGHARLLLEFARRGREHDGVEKAGENVGGESPDAMRPAVKLRHLDSGEAWAVHGGKGGQGSWRERATARPLRDRTGPTLKRTS